jgi:Tfp pilus assembly protein PilZ
MEERRIAKRISIFLAVKEINHKPVGSTFLLNISDTGAKIETPRRYNSGDLVEFSFVLPEMKKKIARQGHVIWVLPHPENPEASLVGLEFSSPWEVGLRSTA